VENVEMVDNIWRDAILREKAKFVYPQEKLKYPQVWNVVCHFRTCGYCG